MQKINTSPVAVHIGGRTDYIDIYLTSYTDGNLAVIAKTANVEGQTANEPWGTISINVTEASTKHNEFVLNHDLTPGHIANVLDLIVDGDAPIRRVSYGFTSSTVFTVKPEIISTFKPQREC